MKRILALAICSAMTVSMLSGCAKDRIEEIENSESEIAAATELSTASEPAEDVQQEASAEEVSVAAETDVKNDEAEGYDLKISARTATTMKNGDILIIDYEVTNNTDETFYVSHLFNTVTQNGVELESVRGANDSGKKDGAEHQGKPVEKGETKLLRGEYALADTKSPVVLGGDEKSKSKRYIQLEDTVTETDAEVIVATEYKDPSDIKCNIDLALLGNTYINDKNGALYVLMSVENRGDEEFNLQDLSVKVVQNDTELKLSGLGDMSVYTRKTLQPGESDIMVAVFLMSEVGDVSISVKDTTEYDEEIASAEYTAKQLYNTSKDFVEKKIDTAPYTERYGLLEMIVEQFMEDLGDVMGN